MNRERTLKDANNESVERAHMGSTQLSCSWKVETPCVSECCKQR